MVVKCQRRSQFQVERITGKAISLVRAICALADSVAEDASAVHDGETSVVPAEEVVGGLAIVLASAGLVRTIQTVRFAVAAHLVGQALAVGTGELVWLTNRN